MDGLVVILITGIMLLTAVLQWLLPVPALTMVVVTAFYFALSLTTFLPRMFRKLGEMKRLRQARDGERAVAEYLDLLREDGHRVFHDVVGSSFNIDHVLVGPKGVFTVETKTLNKRVDQNISLRFDGETVRVGEAVLPDNPVPQALAQASWLRRTLTDSTGKVFGVKPVVVFPGWFVEPSKRDEVWVLEPKALKGFLANEPLRMKPEDITLAVFHLKRYIRASNT
jgi:hypothetical protein